MGAAFLIHCVWNHMVANFVAFYFSEPSVEPASLQRFIPHRVLMLFRNLRGCGWIGVLGLCWPLHAKLRASFAPAFFCIRYSFLILFRALCGRGWMGVLGVCWPLHTKLHANVFFKCYSVFGTD